MATESRSPRIIVDLSGGLLDGAALDSDAPDADQAEGARAIHRWTRDRKVGARFARVSPAASQTNAPGWGSVEAFDGLPAYHYEVTGWLEAEGEILIRAQFVGTRGRPANEER